MLDLKVYMDMGAKVAPAPIMCVGVAVFDPVSYVDFATAWNQMLSGWGASAFHATDFYNGAREFKRDTTERQAQFEHDSKQIPRVVGGNIARSLMVAFRPDEFRSQVTPAWIAEYGDSVHMLAVQLALVSMGWWAKDRNFKNGFSYFVESGDKDAGAIADAVRRLRKDPESATHNQVKSFAEVDKGDARGLEAADFVAWHWNKYFTDIVRNGKSFNEARKDFRAFVGSTSGDADVDEMFLTDSKLRYFLQLGEQKRLGAIRMTP